MKTRFYKLSLPFLLIAVLASCMKSETEPVSMPVSGEADLEFSYSVPDYTVVRTKSAESTVNDISLLQFDADGRFLGRSVASDLQGGTFKAKVSGSTRIVHFIANYDWSAFDERGSLGKDERTLVPDLESDTWVLWDRKTVDNFNAPPQVRLLRNQAKVTVEIDQNLLDLMAQGNASSLPSKGSRFITMRPAERSLRSVRALRNRSSGRPTGPPFRPMRACAPINRRRWISSLNTCSRATTATMTRLS